MTHKIIGLIGLLIYAHSAFAQEVKAEMNRIKMDESYIKAEVNDTSKVAAFEQAVDELLVMVTDTLKNKENAETFTREELMTHLQSLELWRGNRIRMFVYAKWAAVLGEEIKPNVLESEQEQDLQEEKAMEMPHTEKEELIVVAQDTVPAGELEEVKVDDRLVVVESLMLMETAWDVQNALQQFKTNGQIRQYGSPLDVQGQLDDKYIIVFNREKRTMMAILTPLNNGVRMNLLNNREESVEQYKGNKAIFFE